MTTNTKTREGAEQGAEKESEHHLKHQAKAASAGPTKATGTGRGLFGRALATRASFRGSEGSGAPALGRVALLAALAALAVFVTTAPAASAALAPGYGPIGTFDPGVGGSGPGHVAVDDATGNVFLADPGNNRVLVFAPDLTPGGTATLLTEFATPSPIGVAVDQTTQAVYVSGQASVVRFLTDGAPVPTYTLDPTYTSPPLTDTEGRLPLAVDPATGDLLVGEGNHVSRYTSAGGLVRSFNGTPSSAGAFRHVFDVVADATHVYVVDYLGEPGTPLGGDGRTRIFQLGVADAFERLLNATDTPTVAAADPLLDRVVAVGRTGVSQNGAQLSILDAGEVTGVADASPPGGVYATGLAADRGVSKRLYLSYSSIGGFGIGVRVFAPAPGAHADSLTSTKATEAELTGLVNPEGKTTKAHFEYCSERDPCAKDNSVAWTSTPEVENLEGTADIPLSVTITGLDPHTGYLVRIRAEDTLTYDFSNIATVTSGDAAPVAETGGVSSFSNTEATVNGTVNPLGVQSTYCFEYGTTTAYGSQSPPAPGGVVGNGFSPRAFSRALSGLQPAATYHYRIVGANSAGTTHGADRTFTTAPQGSPQRGYEMVSPVQKNGIGVSTAFSGTRASSDGNRVMYGTEKAPFPGAEDAAFVPRVLGVRSSDGWSDTNLGLPLSNLEPGHLLYYDTLAVSSDVRKALILSREALSAGAVQGGWNLYIREPGAVAPNPEFTFVASNPLLGGLSSETGAFQLYGTSEDLRTTAFTDAGGLQMYEATVGEGVRLVSEIDGAPSKGRVGLIGGTETDANYVSSDGSHIFFNSGSPSNAEGALYLRENGVTIPISVSQVPGDSTDPVGGVFLGASPSGRYAEFTTCGDVPPPGALTPGAPSGGSIYRYDAVTGKLIFLTSCADDEESAAVEIQRIVPRPEQESVYFATASEGLFHAHDGVRTLISADAPSTALLATRASPNGRYLAFTSIAKLTSYENAGHPELYLYDSEFAGPVGAGESIPPGSLTCPSCRTDGGPATGQVQIGLVEAGQSILAGYKPNVVLDNGTVFFDTTDPLVSADVNGTRDVYSFGNGRATLISGGRLPTFAQFAEATPDGSDVYFSTDERLVGQDQDNSQDLYDARIGGGIASQSARLSGECASQGCRTPVAAPPPPPPSGSESLVGPGNPKPKKPTKHKKKHHPKKHKHSNQKKRAGHNRGGSK